jgi:NADP-dependent 3-hydroxy acid dehydrogenase YdfG
MAAPERIFRLDGKLALVTGASSGLGQHFVSVLAAAGARVALAARRVDKLQTMVNDLVASGIEARAFAMDVSDAASVAQALMPSAPGARLTLW